MLAHGLFGFRRIGVGPVTLARYFRGIPAFLEEAGNRVLVTQVPAISSIETRSRVLEQHIREAFGGCPVHIIAHSMGGLDARALLSREGNTGLIKSLTTIATPHLGSTLADLAKLRLNGVYKMLESLHVDHAGFVDITRRAARAFHRHHSVPDGVPCFSVAGDPHAEDVCRPLRRCFEVLERFEGPNDGLVSVESATAFGKPLASWSVDHLRQMNWLTSRPSEEVFELYVDLLENLAEHGFARRGAREMVMA